MAIIGNKLTKLQNIFTRPFVQQIMIEYRLKDCIVILKIEIFPCLVTR